jgi:hypothetical protein
MNEQQDVYFEPAEALLQDNQAATTALLFALALGLGAILTVLFVQNNKKDDDVRDRISHMADDRMDEARDTVKRLEKEYAHLRKKVEEVLQR